MEALMYLLITSVSDARIVETTGSEWNYYITSYLVPHPTSHILVHSGNQEFYNQIICILKALSCGLAQGM